MSKDSSNEPRSGKLSFTRRRFVQSTALVTGLSVGGKQLIEPSSVQAQERVADVPVPGPRAPVAPVQNVPPIPAEPPISLEEFIKLSQVLTGLDNLELDLAAQYLQRCADNPEVSGQLENLIQTLTSLKGSRRDLENGFHDKLVAEGVNSPFFSASEQIIYLWYVGAFFKKVPSSSTGARFWDYGLPQHYFRGKVWSVIGVDPPMTAHRSTNFWTRPGRNGA
jgi:hypothetical protein